MTAEKAISDYILDCVKSGVSSPDEICNRAFDRIKEIDQSLNKADTLRPERTKLIQVMKTFGKELPKQAKKIIPSIPTSSNQEDLDAKSQVIVFRTCSLLKSVSGLKARDIMTACGINTESDHLVYSVIRWMEAKKIIVRSEDGTIIRGANWTG